MSFLRTVRLTACRCRSSILCWLLPAHRTCRQSLSVDVMRQRDLCNSTLVRIIASIQWTSLNSRCKRPSHARLSCAPKQRGFSTTCHILLHVPFICPFGPSIYLSAVWQTCCCHCHCYANAVAFQITLLLLEFLL